ncbi:MAG: hypothetical protein ACKO7W_14350 [Elainella sp.]
MTEQTPELQRAKALKQELVDFILDAEDDLAIALETFSATQLARMQQTDLHRRDLAVDRFAIEGQVGSQTPIDRFIQAQSCSDSDQAILRGWRRGFVGLFEIAEATDRQFELINWTTAKRYPVLLDEAEGQTGARLKAGDILLAQIVPLLAKPSTADPNWMFFGPWISLGRLGKPKLAVAIGNFKQSYRDHLYSDAPELLAEAWKSVEKYHQQFTDFFGSSFGSSEVTLSGYELSKKLSEFQEVMLKRQLEAAGVDETKSLQDLADEAGLTEAEIAAAAEELGADAKAVQQLIKPGGLSQSGNSLNRGNAATRMMTPQTELPPPLKKAEQVTVLTHPRWGQVFLTHYGQFEQSLQAEATEPNPLVKKYLEDSEIPAFVWHHLAQKHPQRLQAHLQTSLNRPDFDLAQLDDLLIESGKSLETELPEIASVPIHLHNLFQEALLEVSKEKAKKNPKTKPTGGFGRR